MEQLVIENTYETPNVVFDPGKGTLVIEGKSIHENTASFFSPILDWLDEYSKNPQVKTVARFQFSYYNTSSKRYVVDILKKLDDIHKKGNIVKIEWHCEEGDEGMVEDGEDFNRILSVPFKIVIAKEED